MNFDWKNREIPRIMLTALGFESGRGVVDVESLRSESSL